MGAQYNAPVKLELLAKKPIPNVRVLTLASGADRLVVARGDQGALVLDARTGKEVGELPKGRLTALDPEGMRAIVEESGQTRAGRYEWNVSLWDLAKVEKVAVINKSHPDDKLGPYAFGKTRLVCIRNRKGAHSLCVFDRAGAKTAETALGKIPIPFHVASSRDEQQFAYSYFTGATCLARLGADDHFDKGRKLVGGVLRIGRNHDRGISKLRFDRSGEHLMYTSFGSRCVHVWSAGARKSVPGKWAKASASDAFFVGEEIALVNSGADGAKITAFALDGKALPRVAQVDREAMLFADVSDDRHIACVGQSGRAGSRAAAPALVLFDVGRGKVAARAKAPAGMSAVRALAACPKRVAIGDAKAGFAVV